MASAETNPWLKFRKEGARKITPAERSVKFKILHAEQSSFHAEAIWKKLAGEFVCVQSSPSINLIVEALRPDEAKTELARRGWRCRWI